VQEQHGVWERIFASFDASRERTWPHVARFLRAVPAGTRVLDLMAGNGRHTALSLKAGHEAWWADWSRPMARLVRSRTPQARIVVGDATRLPFRHDAFDACIFVAGLHGVRDPAGRHACLRELRRVLRPGGRAQITVWSRNAPRFRDQGDPGQGLDVTIPWRAHGHDETRTYHLYTSAGIRQAAEQAGLRVLGVQEVAVVSREADNLVADVAVPGEPCKHPNAGPTDRL